MGTGAMMSVTNQTNTAFTTSLSNLNCMYENGEDGSNLQVFGNLQLAPYTSSELVYIEANGAFPICSFSQSSFQINFLGESLGINLGTAPDFNTAVILNTNPLHLQAVLAPTAPAQSGPSYTFYLYGGHTPLAPLINSVINANLAAFSAAVSQSPFVVPVGPLTVSISGINVSNLNCPYAAAMPGEPDQLQFTVILNATGTASGSVKVGPVTNPFDISVTDLVILVEGTANLSSASPQVTVTRFACSLGAYDINIALLEWLLTLPGWLLLQTFATAPDVAGIINSEPVNGTIVDALNSALSNV